MTRGVQGVPMDRTVIACPDCNTRGIRPRHDGSGKTRPGRPRDDGTTEADWKCYECGAVVDEPLRRPPDHTGREPGWQLNPDG